MYDLNGQWKCGLSSSEFLEELAPDVEECQLEWDGHKVIS